MPVLLCITAEPESAYERFEALASYAPMVYEIACVASVSVWCLSKKRPWKGIFGFDRARNETRTKKGKRGEGKGKERNLPFFPNPSRSFTCAIFRSVFDSCSSFFTPKQHRNACCAGYVRNIKLFVTSIQHHYSQTRSSVPVANELMNS